MWQFLNNLLETLKKANWKAIWAEIVKIPNSIKYGLVFAILIAGGYFGYTKITTNTNINALYVQVATLDEKVSTVISESDYNVDVEYMLTALYILEEMNDQIYNISLHNRDCIEHNMQHWADPNDQYLLEIRRSHTRIEQQHNALKNHLNSMVDKLKKKYPNEKSSYSSPEEDNK